MEHKEILTREHIKEDLLNYPVPNRIALAVSIVLVLLPGVFVSVLFSLAMHILFILFEAMAVWWLVTELTNALRYRFAYHKDNFIVKKDVLVPFDRDRGSTRDDWTFCFSSFGFYRFSIYKRFYKWSNMYCLDAEGMRIYADIDDTFYIVTVDGKHPLVVYNTKLFEYKE